MPCRWCLNKVRWLYIHSAVLLSVSITFWMKGVLLGQLSSVLNLCPLMHDRSFCTDLSANLCSAWEMMAPVIPMVDITFCVAVCVALLINSPTTASNFTGEWALYQFCIRQHIWIRDYNCLEKLHDQISDGVGFCWRKCLTPQNTPAHCLVNVHVDIDNLDILLDFCFERFIWHDMCHQ